MNYYNYTTNLQLMTNNELLRESESIKSLLPFLEIQYPVFKNKAIAIDKELQKRAMIN